MSFLCFTKAFSIFLHMSNQELWRHWDQLVLSMELVFDYCTPSFWSTLGVTIKGNADFLYGGFYLLVDTHS